MGSLGDRISGGGIMKRYLLATLALAGLASPLTAKEGLGIFGDWGAFRDPNIPRCYAIAQPASRAADATYRPYVTIGTWPLRKIRGQVHFRLSRKLSRGAVISLTIGRRNFALKGGGGDAWSRDAAMDAAIVAAMRSASSMRVRSRDEHGKGFSDTYRLTGAASALDAATVGCVQRSAR